MKTGCPYCNTLGVMHSSLAECESDYVARTDEILARMGVLGVTRGTSLPNGKVWEKLDEIRRLKTGKASFP